MRDLVLSLLIGSTVIFGATETIGFTHYLDGQDPSLALRRAVHDVGVPSLPEFPEISMPDPRSFFPTSGSVVSSPTPSTVAGQPAVAGKAMFISHTDGSGVRARPTCSDAAVGSTGVAEGAAVEFVRSGGGDCPGWGLVRSGGLEFWVRMSYLDASPPKTAGQPALSHSVPAPAPPVAQGGGTQPGQGPADAGDKEREKSEDKANKSKEAAPTETPTAASSPVPPPTVTSTSTPTATANPKRTPTPLPDLPPEDEQ